ncbi:LuxR C-terminal-related transcriptional regulator [Nocardia ninae]|uniref:LuxR family transcriptional regulator n=2 Tax=Nocardia ninae TaxID=356145 RepID=A0A511MEG7_9NOCA|nr:LuxR family transcriptional regulator [Nocardia ninae NBRC 108245]
MLFAMLTDSLPAELSSFIGRAEELGAIGAAVTAGQVLTLVGPGGGGKTRLALRVCRDLRAAWPDGVRWVGLEDEHDDAGVVHRVAAALEVLLPAGADPVTALTHGIGDRETLLALDNCEQVSAGAATLVTALLTHCPRLAVLATSRAPLGVPGERIRRIPALGLADALALFLDRAQLGTPNTEARNAARRICDRLDRLPLALELAAGWAGTLSLAQLADSLCDPYAVLDGGARTAPFRQRTLAESMRWSHDLLDDDERVLFRRLGVFEPGFTAAEVTELGGTTAALRALRGLIEKSLLSADTSRVVARYRMLGVVRDYALRQLAEAGETELFRQRHAAVYLALVERAEALLDTDQDAWRARITLELPNIRAAIDWGLSQDDPSDGRELAAAMAWLWHLEPRGLEGVRVLRSAVDRGSGARDALQARVLLGLALVCDTAVYGFVGYESARAAAELADEVGAEAVSRRARSLCAVEQLGIDLNQAQALASAVHQDALRAGDDSVADSTQALLGLIHLFRDEYRTAIDQLDQALVGMRRRNDRGFACHALTWLATATARMGELPRAAEIAETAVGTATPLRDFHHVGSARATLAEIRVWQGRLEEAASVLVPIDRVLDGADAPFVPGWERVHGMLSLAAGHPAQAIAWCRREGRIAGEADGPVTPWTQVVLAAALREHGESAEAAALLDALVAGPLVRLLPSVHADALDQQAYLVRPNDIEQSLRLHHEALHLRVEHELVLGCVASLEALAAVLTLRGTVETACVLLGAAERARADTGSAPARFLAEVHAQLSSRVREPELTECLDRGRSMGVAQAVDYATKARGKRNRPDTGWASLTPTERSVVDLAVSGMSNPEIATRLFISRGTVKTHLAHVYAKLGVANRTELARLDGRG